MCNPPDYLEVLWKNIKAKCLKPDHPKYPAYGGRGISIYEPWVNDRKAFEAWITANLGERPFGLTLDRENNNGHYEPGNLRWATPWQQNVNRRSNHASEDVGIYPNTQGPGWLVYVKRKYYGRYLDKEFARQIRDAAL